LARLQSSYGRRNCDGATASRRLQMWNMMFLLPLHPSVLKPDFDLAFAKVENVCDLNAATTRQVAVEVEFFLQLQRLVSRV